MKYNIILVYLDKVNKYIAFQPFDKLDICLKADLVGSLNTLYELFSDNLRSEDKIYVSTYLDGNFKAYNYIITTDGWRVND